MRAAVATGYGAPEVVRVEERPRPEPGPGEILVRVDASTVGSSDAAFRLGEPRYIRLFFGLKQPRQPILGGAFAGEVVAVGADVSQFRLGSRVYGDTGAAMGANVEYLVVRETGPVVALPDTVSPATAVTLADGGMTALPFLRDSARLQPGQLLLVNGASGAVGAAAVQLGRHLGAHVTAVTSTPNLDLVRDLGADDVIDYTIDDFTASSQRWDVVFDAVGLSRFARAKRVLTPTGIYLTTVPGVVMIESLFTKRAGIAFTGLRKEAAKRPDFAELARLAAAGELAPLIDSEYPLAEVAAAHARVDSKRKRGTVVVLPQQ
jgi:NADPH:quinone reductase-like Zn-dependent oxidoreductase